MKYAIYKTETPEECQILEGYQHMLPNAWVYEKLDHEKIYRSFASFCLAEDWKNIVVKPMINGDTVNVFDILGSDLKYLGSIDPTGCITTLKHFAQIHKCIISETISFPRHVLEMRHIVLVDCNEEFVNPLDAFITESINTLSFHAMSVNKNWVAVLKELLKLEEVTDDLH